MPPIVDLTADDKFEYLFNLIHLMKIDQRVYLSEIRFCEELAEKLGYKKQVVSVLSGKIFGDTAIGPGWDELKSIAENYKLV